MDSIELLKLARNATHSQLETNHTTIRYMERYSELFTSVQGKNMSNNNYFAQFKGLVESI